MARRWKIAFYAGLGIVGLLAVLVLAVAAGLLWLAGDGGRAWLEARLEAAASGPGARLEIGRLVGRPPFAITVEDVAVADADGVWLRLDRGEIVIDPWPLLLGRVEIERLAGDGLALARLPAAPPADAESDTTTLPSLPPVAIEVETIAFPGIEIGAAVPGGPARLDLAGRLALSSSRVALDLEAVRRDDVPGRLDAAVDYAPGDDRLAVDVTYREAADGLLAGLLRLDGRPPTALEMTGDGPVAAWRGQVTAAAGDQHLVALDVAIDGVDPRRLALDGGIDLPAGLSPLFRDLPTQSVDVEVAARFGADGAVAIETARLDSDGARLEASGRWVPGGAVDGHADLALERLAPWARLAGVDAGGSVHAAFDLAGTAAAPVATLRLDLAGAEGLGFGDLGLDATAERDPSGAWIVDLAGTAGGLDAPLADFGARADIALTAALDADLAGADIAYAHAAVGPLSLALTGRVPLAGGAAAVDASLRLDEIARAPGAATLLAAGHGEVALRGTIDAAAETADLVLDGAFENLDWVDPLLDAALGAAPRLGADIVQRPGEKLRLRDGRIVGRRIALGLNADAAADLSRVAASYRLDVDDFAALADAVGIDAGGRLAASGTARLADGDLAATAEVDGRDLSYGGRAFGPATATIDAAGLLGEPRAEIALDAAQADTRLRATVTAADGAYRLADLAATIAGQSLSGDLTVRPDGPLATGTLRLDAPDLARLAPFAGIDLAGAARGDVSLDAEDGSQQVSVDATLSNLGVAGTTLTEATLEGAVRDLLGTPDADLRLAARDVDLGGRRLDSMTARLRGTGPYDVAIEAEASSPVAATLDAEATLALDEGTTLTLSRLDLAAKGADLALARPATISFGDAGLRVAGLELDGSLGRLGADLELDADTVAGEATVDGLDLAALSAFVPGLPVAGTASASLRLSGSPAAPAADAELDWQPPRQGAAGLSASATWRDDRVAVEAEVSGVLAQPLVARLSLPLVYAADPFALEVPADGALEGEIGGRGRLGDLEALVPIGANKVGGTADVDLSVGGTVGTPRVTGSVAIASLSIENLDTGFRLVNGEARLTTDDGRRFDLDLSGGDGAGGSLRGNGGVTVDPDQGFPFEATLDLDRYRVTDRDELQAQASAELRVEGDTDGIAASGTATVHRAEVELPDKLPSSVTVIDYTHVNCPDCAPPEEDGEESETIEVMLDIAVDIPNRLFVRGRGLESEWRGRLVFAGTADAPRVTGELEVIGGQLDLIGNVFSVEQGRISFTGGRPIDPALDIRATASRNDVTGTIRISGTASKPDIGIGSGGGLPEDEVLSRLLFGRSTGDLSTAETLQLANALATLTGATGSGPGVVDRLRRSLGVDVLNVGTDAGGASLSVGKYLTEDLFLSLEQGTSGKSNIAVEYEIYPDVTIESDVGAEDSTGFGINWQYDY